jgi:hypothetical protein
MAKANKVVVETVTFVKNTVVQLDALRTRRVSWEATDYKKANDGLYGLLADTLAIYDDKFLKATDQERKDLRKELEGKLKADGIKVQKNTTTLTMLVRFVFGSDRKRAHGYTYVLKAAVSHSVTAKVLPEYIAEQGGIEEIKRKMVQSDAAKQRQVEVEQAKTKVLADLELANIKPLAKVKLAGLTGKYAILLAKPGVDGEAAIVGTLSDIEDALYNALIKKMAKVKAADIAENTALKKEATDLLAPANDADIADLLAA